MVSPVEAKITLSLITQTYLTGADLDVASNRKMLQALLKRNGAKYVDTAENGLEAVQVAQANGHKYDVIFMDNFMPVMVTTYPIHTDIKYVPVL